MSVKYKEESHKSEIGIDSSNQSESFSEKEIVQGNPVYFPGTGIYENTNIDAYSSRLYPHWELQSVIYHACFRLADSVPMDMQRQWLEERKQFHDICEKEHRTLTDIEIKRFKYLYSERIEHFLDSGYGSCILQRPEIAEIMHGSLEYYNKIKYLLHAWCIMPNHVHVLVEVADGFTLSTILHSWRSYTAHKANKILCRTGEFWQSEYFDRFIRNTEHLCKTIEYIFGNPDKAGLVEWKWRGVLWDALSWEALSGGAGGPPAKSIDAGEPPAPR